jgi:hypothetical protein
MNLKDNLKLPATEKAAFVTHKAESRDLTEVKLQQ